MNGLSAEETRRAITCGQRVLADGFGAPARGFLAPAWQRGQVRVARDDASGLEHVLGFFSLASASGRAVPLATFTWDCGRWGWLGHVGHALGGLSHALGRGAPTLAIHPRDLERGFWPRILRLTRELVADGALPFADDAHRAALLATCLLRTPSRELAETLALVLDVYGDDDVTRPLAERFGQAAWRPLAFHLGQAALPYRRFREIGRLLRERYSRALEGL